MRLPAVRHGREGEKDRFAIGEGRVPPAVVRSGVADRIKADQAGRPITEQSRS